MATLKTWIPPTMPFLGFFWRFFFLFQYAYIYMQIFTIKNISIKSFKSNLEIFNEIKSWLILFVSNLAKTNTSSKTQKFFYRARMKADS
jgi:hypothetical protein